MAINPLLQAALHYSELGFSVIPIIPGQKKPLVKWETFQKQRADKNTITSWWMNNPKANIGIVTGEISDIFVVDIDTDEGQNNLLQFGFDSIVTPTVKTPRGGQHLYFKYPTGHKITIGAGLITGTDFRGNGGYVLAPPSSNGEGSAYAWLDDLTFARNVLASLPAQYIKRISSIDNTTLVVKDTTSHYKDYIILQEHHRNDDLFYVANWLTKGGRGEEYVRQVLRILAKNCNPPFPDKEIELVIKSALDRAEKKERNLTDEVREYILLQKDYITVTNILQMLHLTTKEEKKHLTVIIHRMQEKGIIEKHGNTPGSYRIKNQDVSKVDWTVDEDMRDFGAKLPLELNRMCIIPPGSIIIIAGSKSSGKTAMLLNIAIANQNDFDCDYLNSEMHPIEFKGRVKKFGGDIRKCKINAYNCAGNFADYIIDTGKPKIYFIDYLEIHEEFFKIGKQIRQIHEKLGDSICFIGLQMKGGGDLGRGAAFSAEKSRLYLTMDYQPEARCTKLLIYDAKIPRDENVRGQYRMVKIIDGYQLTPMAGDAGRWQW